MGRKRKQVSFEPYALSVADAAQFSGCGESHMWEAVKKREVDVVKDGRRTLILVASLKRRLDAMLQP